MVCENDLWDGEDIISDQEDYVLVKQEDIVEGIACFMAAYLLSLKQTKVFYLYSLLYSGGSINHTCRSLRYNHSDIFFNNSLKTAEIQTFMLKLLFGVLYKWICCNLMLIWYIGKCYAEKQ